MRAAKVQASLRIRAVSPEPSLLAHTNSESRGTFRQKARSLAPLNGWACAVEICHDGMLEDTNSLDGAQLVTISINHFFCFNLQTGVKLITFVCGVTLKQQQQQQQVLHWINGPMIRMFSAKFTVLSETKCFYCVCVSVLPIIVVPRMFTNNY